MQGKQQRFAVTMDHETIGLHYEDCWQDIVERLADRAESLRMFGRRGLCRVCETYTTDQKAEGVHDIDGYYWGENANGRPVAIGTRPGYNKYGRPSRPVHGDACLDTCEGCIYGMIDLEKL